MNQQSYIKSVSSNAWSTAVYYVQPQVVVVVIVLWTSKKTLVINNR